MATIEDLKRIILIHPDQCDEGECVCAARYFQPVIAELEAWRAFNDYRGDEASKALDLARDARVARKAVDDA